MSNTVLRHIRVARTDLARALREGQPNDALRTNEASLLRTKDREVYIFWKGHDRRPCAIAVNDDEREELFNWTATYHRDLSPLTSWCHVLSLKDIERVGTDGRSSANLFGYEAAWAGAAISEAMVLANRSYDAISLPACLATETYAIGRSVALYGVRSAFDSLDNLQRVKDRLKKPPERWRPATTPIVAVLLRLLPDAPPIANSVQQTLVDACRAIESERHSAPSRRSVLASLIAENSKLRPLGSLEELPAEQRVRLLREMPAWVASAQSDEERQLLNFAAGYAISLVGGAERDLRLAEIFGVNYPFVLAWAAIVGSLGASTYWADAFGGIGRLVSRELSREVDLFSAPTSDISADEFLVVTSQDSGMTRVRTALRQAATLSLKAGVVIQLSVHDDDRSGSVDERTKSAQPRAPSQTLESAGPRNIQSLAESLFPYLRHLLIEDGFEHRKDKRFIRKGRGPELPLK